VRYFGGASERVMIDNTHVVVLRGTGREMVPVPEMAAYGERFVFRCVPMRLATPTVLDASSGRSTSSRITFLAGRTFSSWEDLNQRVREWCDKVNSTYKKHTERTQAYPRGSQ